MKKLSFSVCLILTCLFATATSIYEIVYTFQGSDGSTQTYTAFLVRYENNTGFMRVKFMHAGQLRVVHMDFDEINGSHSEGTINYETLRFQGKSPFYVKGNSGNYTPDILWFRKKPSENNFKMWGVTSPQNDGTTHQGRLVSVRLLNSGEISRDYARQYFNTDDGFYANLFSTDQVETSLGSVRLVMIANTTDLDIGVSCRKDANRMKQKFGEIANFLNMPFQYTEIAGSNFNRTNAYNAVSNLSSSPNDIIIICFSGHGFRYNSTSDSYPLLDFTTSINQSISGNSLHLSEFYNLLNNKAGRFKILLADCCNNYIRESKNLAGSTANMRKSRVQWDLSNCQKLFTRTTGTLVVAAANRGELAYCNENIGGYFIFNFIESIDKALSVFENGKSWNDIITETRNSVVKMSNSTACDRQSCTQEPISYINLNN